MFHFGPIWGIKDEESMEKTFIRRHYTIVLRFWDEFNANFVLLYFSSYWSITIWNLFPKMSEKKKKKKNAGSAFKFALNLSSPNPLQY